MAHMKRARDFGTGGLKNEKNTARIKRQKIDDLHSVNSKRQQKLEDIRKACAQFLDRLCASFDAEQMTVLNNVKRELDTFSAYLNRSFATGNVMTTGSKPQLHWTWSIGGSRKMCTSITGSDVDIVFEVSSVLDSGTQCVDRGSLPAVTATELSSTFLKHFMAFAQRRVRVGKFFKVNKLTSVVLDCYYVQLPTGERLEILPAWLQSDGVHSFIHSGAEAFYVDSRDGQAYTDFVNAVNEYDNLRLLIRLLKMVRLKEFCNESSIQQVLPSAAFACAAVETAKAMGPQKWRSSNLWRRFRESIKRLHMRASTSNTFPFPGEPHSDMLARLRARDGNVHSILTLRQLKKVLSKWSNMTESAFLRSVLHVA